MVVPVYVINLPYSTDRLSKFKSQANLIGGLENIHVIEAINGKELSTNEISENATALCSKFCTYGMIGCAMSHRKAWQTIVDNGDEYAIVMEDDCKVSDSFNDSLNAILDEIKRTNIDVDMVYLGCFGGCSYNGKYSLISRIQTTLLHKIEDRKYSNIELETLYIPEAPVGFHCYLVSRVGAQKMLKYLSTVRYHVDVAFLDFADHFNIYASKNKIGMQMSTAENSVLTDSTFPILLNSILDSFNVTDENNISYSYYLSTPLIEFAGMSITTYTIILAIMTFIPGGYIFVSMLTSIEVLYSGNIDSKNLPWILLSIFGFLLNFYNNKK